METDTRGGRASEVLTLLRDTSVVLVLQIAAIALENRLLLLFLPEYFWKEPTGEPFVSLIGWPFFCFVYHLRRSHLHVGCVPSAAMERGASDGCREARRESVPPLRTRHEWTSCARARHCSIIVARQHRVPDNQHRATATCFSTAHADAACGAARDHGRVCGDSALVHAGRQVDPVGSGTLRESRHLRPLIPTNLLAAHRNTMEPITSRPPPIKIWAPRSISGRAS